MGRALRPGRERLAVPPGRGPATLIFPALAWTGAEILVWGTYHAHPGVPPGYSSDPLGARYDPAADTWRPMSAEGAPRGWIEGAVWTGRELIVGLRGVELVGGGGDVLPAGGAGAQAAEPPAPDESWAAYDPQADRWRALPLHGGPGVRMDLTAVWDGRRVLVWGGQGWAGPPDGGLDGYMDRGVGYDPATDRWEAFDGPGDDPNDMRVSARAVMAGATPFVWGGRVGSLGTDGVPADYGWRRTGGRWERVGSGPQGPGPRASHSLVWTGASVIVWGGWRGEEQAAMPAGFRLRI